MMMRVILVFFCCLGAGCATKPGPAPDQNANGDAEGDTEEYVVESYCSPSLSPYPKSGETASAGAAVQPTQMRESLLFLSPAIRQIAQVIHVEELVAQIPVLEWEVLQNIEGARLRLLEMRQELSDQLLLALFDASSVAAELECEKGRAEALAAGLDEVQNDIQQRRTVIALLSDATAGLLLQPRNLLQEVWEGPKKSVMFPESVWRYLNWPQASESQRSRRDAIVQEWTKHLGDPGSEKEGRRKQLFFGEGGIYSVPELRHWAEMLDRLKASVRLMSRDLNLLFKETLGHLSGAVRMAQSRMVPIE